MSSVGRRASLTPSTRRSLYGSACLATGLGLGWAASGRLVAVAATACLLAAANGYSKAHSP